jgi:hypothetical protein
MSSQFDDAVRDDPEIFDKIKEIAAQYTRDDETGERTQRLADYLQDELRRQWPNIKTNWKGLANHIARIHAPRQAAQEREADAKRVDLDALQSHADEDADTPAQLVISQEERAFVRRALSSLPESEWNILQAFAKSKSSREAAAVVGLAGAAYRKRLSDIIARIKPKPDVWPPAAVRVEQRFQTVIPKVPRLFQAEIDRLIAKSKLDALNEEEEAKLDEALDYLDDLTLWELERVSLQTGSRAK